MKFPRELFIYILQIKSYTAWKKRLEKIHIMMEPCFIFDTNEIYFMQSQDSVVHYLSTNDHEWTFSHNIERDILRIHHNIKITLVEEGCVGIYRIKFKYSPTIEIPLS